MPSQLYEYDASLVESSGLVPSDGCVERLMTVPLAISVSLSPCLLALSLSRQPARPPFSPLPTYLYPSPSPSLPLPVSPRRTLAASPVPSASLLLPLLGAQLHPVHQP